MKKAEPGNRKDLIKNDQFVYEKELCAKSDISIPICMSMRILYPLTREKICLSISKEN